MAQLFDWLFGSEQGDPQVSTQATAYPEWVKQPTQELIKTATQVAGRPYVPYQGARIAPLGPDEEAAMQRTREMQGIGGLAAGRGLSMAEASGRAISPEEIESYISPYQKQVTDIAAGEMERRSQIAGLGETAQARRAGAFGGTRHAVLEAERAKNLSKGVGELYQTSMAQGYESAMDRLMQQRGIEKEAGLATGMLGTQQQTLGYQDVMQRLGIGQLQRGIGQRSLDVGYEDFMRQQQYPERMTQYMAGILGKTPMPSTTTYTSPGQPEPGFFQQAAGLGIAGLGTAGQLGWRPFS